MHHRTLPLLADALAELLESGLVRRLVVLSEMDLSAPLVNDIYKYRMMKVCES